MELDFSSQTNGNNSAGTGTPGTAPVSPTTPPANQGANIPIASVSNGHNLSQAPSAPVSNGRMDEIMSEQVTTKNTDTISPSTGSVLPQDKPKKSRLTLILLIVFLVLLLGGGAFVVFATDFGKNLLGKKNTVEEVFSSIDNNATSTTGTGSTTVTDEATENSTATTETTTSETATDTATDTTASSANTTSPIAKNDTTRKSHILQIQTAVEAYKTANGSYPISKTYAKVTDSTSEIYSLLVPDYLATMPQDPKSTESWWYGYKSVDGVNYAVTARLEDTTDTTGVLDGEVFLYILTN